jgi:hypothetical protein
MSADYACVQPARGAEVGGSQQAGSNTRLDLAYP